MEPPGGLSSVLAEDRLAARPQAPVASLDYVQGWFKSRWDFRGRFVLGLGLGLSLSLLDQSGGHGDVSS